MKILKNAFIVFLVTMAMMVLNGQNDILAATATVNTGEVHQTIEGFGASLAWWHQNLYSHPQKGEIYNYLFKELGLDILRLRNIYGRVEDDAFSMFGEFVDTFYSLSENDPAVMISSWTPPANLKSNGSLSGGTLDTTATGEYVYGDFAQYWVDALDSFATVGIVPDYISIQNEPDYTDVWETCILIPTESSTYAGYDQALDSVYRKFRELPSPPKILASEVTGLDANLFQDYADEFNHDNAYGYAYHLYNGGSPDNSNPDAFIPNLTEIANNYSDKPIFQTEYYYGGWFNTAWLMHNCLVYGNVSGYFFWTAAWGYTNNTFIDIGDESTYVVNQIYWAFRQYSKAIHYGWKRVGATVDADSLLVSAFINSAGNELSTIIINISHSNDSLALDISGFDMSGANMLRTTDGEQCALVGYYDGSTLNIPARSITTISTLEITPGSDGVEEENDNDLNVDCSLAQNYPNPFNTATTVEYSISREGFVRLVVYDISGREVKTPVERIMPAGKHTVNIEANDLSSGIYFYQLETGGKNIRKKMILIK